MCGIVGIVRPGRPIRNDEISRFTRAVAHRGPDDEGVWRHGDIAIGHSRLSVIDIDHGQQPMSSHDHKIWLTYNGEIYNFRELRAELGKRGREPDAWIWQNRLQAGGWNKQTHPDVVAKCQQIECSTLGTTSANN
ncbi:hypothetical protein N9H39_11240 [Gammaproteobacteria bacterium]|nr:hypothetical protein [Gammaproteobacteria bacterium]